MSLFSRRRQHAMSLCFGGNTGMGPTVIIYCPCGWSHMVAATLVLQNDGVVSVIYDGHLLRLAAEGER